MAPESWRSLRGVKRPHRYKRGTVLLRETMRLSRTALHLAAMNGKRRVVEILLSRGSAVRGSRERIAKKDLWGDTPLHLAASKGHLDIVTLLLEAGAEPNEGGNGGATPLHRAVNQEHYYVTQKLLEGGADAATRNSGGQTALHVAAEIGHVTLVELLLRANASPNERDNSGQNALHLAAASSNTRLTEILLRSPVDIQERTNDGRIALDFAFAARNWETTKILLDKGVPKRELTGAEPTTRPLAANRDIIALLKQYTDDWPEHTTVLNTATSFGNEALISRLLEEHGVDVTSRDSEGTTALHIAAAKGHCECVSLLLGYGADIYQRDLQDHTALHLAVLHGQPETLSLLLQAADPAEIGQDFFTAFSKQSLLDQPPPPGVHFNCNSFQTLEPRLLALAEAGNVGVLKAFFELQKRSTSKLWEWGPTSSESLVRLLMENNTILDRDNPEGKEIVERYLQTSPKVAVRLIMTAKEELFVDSFLEDALDIAVRNDMADVVDFLLQRGIDPARVQSVRSLSLTGRIFNEMKRELSSIPAQRFERKTVIKLEELREALSELDAETMEAALTPWHEILPRIPFAALACGNEGLLRILPRNIVAGAGKDMEGHTLLQRAHQLGDEKIVDYILQVSKNQ